MTTGKSTGDSYIGNNDKLDKLNKHDGMRDPNINPHWPQEIWFFKRAVGWLVPKCFGNRNLNLLLLNITKPCHKKQVVYYQKR